MEEKEIRDDIASIRSLMERSSKFISLSGLSGVLAGIYALIGAAVAYLIIQNNPLGASDLTSFFKALDNALTMFYSLTCIAIAVLIASVLTAFILSIRKAKKNGQSIWNKTSRDLTFNMSIPLITGGIVIIILLYQGYPGMIVPAMLIFYGISLFNAGNFTFNDIRYLGLSEIVLGLIAAACLPVYGLLFWAIGFGILHIVYGSVMYLKYDR